MEKDRNDFLESPENLKYQPAIEAEDFFSNLIRQGEAEFKKQASLSLFFNIIMNKISLGLVKFVERIIRIKLCVPEENFFLPTLSFGTRKLLERFSQKNIIQKIRKVPRIYFDEPDIINYAAEISNISLYSDGEAVNMASGGTDDIDEERAIIKALAEGLERFCTSVYREKNLLLSSYKKISKIALNPLSFAGLSSGQRQTKPEFKIDENSLFRWVKGFSLFNKKEVYIPAQLIYIGYKYHKEEPIIYQQITTGAAAADSFSGALYKGVCEAVERDAFMISYLNKLSPPLIEAEAIEDERIQRILAMIKRHNLELYLVDITTDIVIPSVLAVVIDRTGIGPAVALGAGADIDVRKAIQSALYEALKIRISFRGILFYESPHKEKLEDLKLNPSKIKIFEDRFLFWAPLEMIEKISFFFHGQKKKIDKEGIINHQNISSKKKLNTVLNLLKGKGIDAYGVDITLPQIKKEGIYVAKVVSPRLQPLYLFEQLKCLGGSRLYNVPVVLGYRKKPLSEEELNPTPHPFL